jgi:hypothetical protein
MNLARNCLKCSHYFECREPAKSLIYTCKRFSLMKASGKQEVALLEDILELPLSSSEDSRIIVPEGKMTKYGGSNLDIYDINFGGFNAFQTIKNIIKDKRIVSPDINIPEGDFAEAPNFYTWCVSDKFLGQKPYLKQALVGTIVFGEYCPECSDMEYIESKHRVDDSLEKFTRKVCLLEHGKCPSCKKTRLNFYRSKKLNPYYELAINAGQRSGKSALFGMLISYLTHRMIKLERPNEVYGLLRATVLQATFVALTYAQAKDTLWEPFYGNLLDSAWFKEYHAMLDDVQSRTGEELYKLKDTFVQYKHRRLLAYPAGPDKRILRGRTRYAAGIDELGWFDNSIEAAKNVKMNANEVYVALENSLGTLRQSARNVIKKGFYNVPFGLFANISSPSSIRDKICELVKKAQHSKVIYGIQAPTWEMNPNLPRSSAFIREKFKNDPVGAMRDFGAQPPLTNNAFLPNKDAVMACMGQKKNALKMHYTTYKTSDGQIEVYGDLEAVKIIARPCILALDAGLSNNSFAFSLGFLGKDDKPIISVVGEVIPTQGMRINHSKMYSHLLSKLFEFCNIVKVVADRWNSLKILADMEVDHDCERQVYSLKYTDMQLFKSYIEDTQVTLPLCTTPMDEVLKYDHSEYPGCFKNKPVEHFMLQLLTVQDTGAGVIKGDQLTDDIARAVFLLFQQLVHEDNQELLKLPEKTMTSHVDASQMAVYRNYSGGGSGSKNGGMGQQVSQGSSLGMTRQRANT